MQTYTANSGATLLPDEVVKLSGDIAWSVDTTDDGPFDAGASWGHIVYVTIAVPINAPSREAGITQKRIGQGSRIGCRYWGGEGSLGPIGLTKSSP